MEFFAHIVLLAFVAFITISAVPGSSLFSWHPTCMALATLLWTESLISFRRPSPSWRVNVHWGVNATAISLAIFGFLSIYRNKEENGKPHFTTYHGIAGISTLGLLLIQTMGGNFANFSVFIGKYVRAVRPSVIKWGHRVSGLLSLTAVYTTLILGLCSFWFTAIVSSTVVWTGVVLSLLYPYLYAIFNADFSQRKGSSKEKAKN
ncbi:unnamed protein product [Orchesella dallaii]|uniref:ascorbate ferrireductase (transmembrane) n=1 Tax=Orchesella dallaii TaxID=48710 RepID=A0ABP1QEE3_9HEXA